MLYLKFETTCYIQLGPFIDAADGKTSLPALAITSAAVKMNKNGDSWTDLHANTSIIYSTAAHYRVPLDSTDVGTLGRLRVYCHPASALPVWEDFTVLGANAYDNLIGTFSFYAVNAIQLASASALLYVATNSGILSVQSILSVINSLMAAKSMLTSVQTYMGTLSVQLSIQSTLSFINSIMATTSMLSVVNSLMATKSMLTSVQGTVGSIQTWGATNSVLLSIQSTLSVVNSLMATKSMLTSVQTFMATQSVQLSMQSTLSTINSLMATKSMLTSVQIFMGTLSVQLSIQSTISYINSMMATNSMLASVQTFMALQSTLLSVQLSVSALNDITTASVWNNTARTLTAATNITDDGNAISNTMISRINTLVSYINSMIATNSMLTSVQTFMALQSTLLSVQTFMATQSVLLSVQTKVEAGGGGVITAGDISDIWNYVSRIVTSAANITSNDVKINNTYIANVWAVTGIISTMIEIDGADYRYTTNALEQAPGGGAGGANTLNIYIKDTTTLISIEDVEVQIWNATLTSKITFGYTNSAGLFTKTISDGSYKVKARKSGCSFSDPFILTVSGDTTATYYGDSIALPAPVSASVCRVYEYCMGIDGNPVSSVTNSAKIVSLPEDLTGMLFIGQDSEGVYNPITGILYWDVPRTAVVQFKITDFGINVTKTIPNTPTARLYAIA
jgi:hypothetical protein